MAKEDTVGIRHVPRSKADEKVSGVSKSHRPQHARKQPETRKGG